MKDDLRYECTRYIISDFLEAEPGPDIVHATVGSGEPMLAHVRYFESMPLAPYPEATFETVQDARRWIASNPRPAWRLLRHCASDCHDPADDCVRPKAEPGERRFLNRITRIARAHSVSHHDGGGMRSPNYG